MAVLIEQFGSRGYWPRSTTEASGKQTDLCSLQTTISTIVGLKFRCPHALRGRTLRKTSETHTK